MEGYLERTPKGRVATDLAYRTLGLVPSHATKHPSARTAGDKQSK